MPIATRRGDDRPGQQVEAGDREAEGDAGQADAGQHQPVEIEALGVLALIGSMYFIAMKMPSSPIGMLIRKIQCQEK